MTGDPTRYSQAAEDNVNVSDSVVQDLVNHAQEDVLCEVLLFDVVCAIVLLEWGWREGG